jgi:two-component system response regulator AtoC
VERFIRQYAAENSKRPMGVSRQAGEALRKYAWPGNVRELEKCIEHALVVADGPEIELEHLPKEILESVPVSGAVTGSSDLGSLQEIVSQVERDLIVKALHQSHWVKTSAARLLGIHESTLRKKMKALGIRAGAEEHPDS